MERPPSVPGSGVLDTDHAINASRISGLQMMVGLLGAAILFVDGFNTQLIGYISHAIAQEWRVPDDVLGWILAADKIGLMIGYLLVAPLSGSYGQKRIAIACITAFGLTALLTTIAGNSLELFVLRLVTGIGLGGALPSGVVLTGEYFPKARRSTAITLIYCGFSLGQASPGEVANLVLEPFGWQAVVLIGGTLAIALAVVLALLLPDSLEYLVNRGGRADKAKTILSRIAPSMVAPETRLVAGERSGSRLSLWKLLPQLFQAGRGLGTLLYWLALGMNLLVNTTLQVWLTKMLIDQGFQPEVSIRATEASFIAGVVCAFIIGPLIDRFGPYRVISGLFLAGAGASVFLGYSLSWAAAGAIIAGSFTSGFCTSGAQKGHNALSVYFYPTALRSTGLGWGLGIGRLGAIFGPVLAGYLLTAGWTPSSVFMATALPMLVGSTAIFLMGRAYGLGASDEREARLRTVEVKA